MRLRVLAVGCCLVVPMAGCSQSPTAPAPGSGRGASPTVSVVASIYPLAYASGEVGKTRVAVKDLTPPGAEPHDIELTPRDIAVLQEAGLIVMVGGGFQPSMERAIAGLPLGRHETYDALAGLTPITEGRIGHEEEKEPDPHFWLDPTLMAEAGAEIAARLARLDPAGSDAYPLNSRDFNDMLSRLDSEFKAGLKVCKRRTIIVAHAAFEYLADRYELTQVSLSGLSPHAEPTPESLATARQTAEATGVTTIFAEPGGDARAAETVAREIGGSVAELDPIEIQQPGKDYPSAMRANLATLRKALECE